MMDFGWGAVWRSWFIGALIIAPFFAIAVYSQEQPRRPTAAELNLQLLNSDLANYRNAAAQLSEKNQQLQDQIDNLTKRCPEVSPQAVPK
jgi:hypothetical protein